MFIDVVGVLINLSLLENFFTLAWLIEYRTIGRIIIDALQTNGNNFKSSRFLISSKFITNLVDLLPSFI